MTGATMIGKTLGHYQAISQLGKSGMGEVYQAKDQKLGCNMAIKVLPEEFAASKAGRESFRPYCQFKNQGHDTIGIPWGCVQSAFAVLGA
jgi:serine/threonine protein kinase